MVTTRYNIFGGIVPMVALLLGVITMPAAADIVLRFSPADQQIELEQASSLAIHLDEPIPIRTIELYVSYDPTILTSTGGIHGQCFSESGAFIFENWEETSPGSWHGYAIVMDALSEAMGPGELYIWSFTADEYGMCPVTVDSVFLFAPDANLIDGVSLPPTTVSVRDPSSVGDQPPMGPVPITLSPNPFNPRTVLQFEATIEGSVKIEVFDGRGRNIGTALSGWADGGPLRVPWDARDRDGRSLGGGVYLFRLEGPNGFLGVAKGMLLK